jgi:transposase
MKKYMKQIELDNQNLQMQELKAAIKYNKNKNMHVKYMVIYQHLQGELNVDIANMYDLCAHTVGSYIKIYKTLGLEGLIPMPKNGAPRNLTPDQEAKLVEIITLYTPDEVGFPFRKNWNCSLIRQWVFNKFEVKYSHSGMLKVLHRLNLSFTRPTYTLEKANPQKQEEFIEQFELLKKSY